MTACIVVLGCGGGPSTTTPARTSESPDFAKLCRAVGAEGDKISREDFLAKDKDAAARLSDACDGNRIGGKEDAS